jgi:hypothetical protein
MSKPSTNNEVAEAVERGEFIPLLDAAARLGIAPHTFRRRLVRDAVPTVRVRRRIYVSVAALNAALLLA